MNFFVENKNQFDLAITISDNLNVDFNIYIFDWDGIIYDWISKHDRFSEVKVINILESSSDEIKLRFKRGFNDSDIYAAYESYFYLESLQNTINILFNDSSRRSKQASLFLNNCGAKRVLIQDGWLSFESSEDKELKDVDNNYFYGATKPDKIFVWGSVFKNELINRHNIPEENVIISGTSKFNLSKEKAKDRNEVSKIFFADQAILDQRKMIKEDWKNAVVTLLENTKQFKVYYKPHPSITQKTVNFLHSLIEDYPNVKLIPKDDNSDEYLNDSDVLITYYSTYSLEALKLSLPVIFFQPKGLDILFPKISNELISYAKEDNLLYVIENGNSLNNDFPSIKSYIESGSIDFISSQINIMVEDLITPKPILDYSKLDKLGTELFLCNLKSVSIYGTDFSFKTGVAKPIRTWAEKINSSPNSTKISIKNLSNRYHWEHYVNSEDADVVIINSISAIIYYGGIIRLINELKRKFKKVFIYCHETSYVFNYEFSRSQAFCNRFEVVKNNLIWLCVSDKQKEFLQASYNIKNAHTVFVSIPEYNYLPTASYTKNELTKICMIGSIQPRKGIKLFIDVANEAKARGLKYEFSWVGHLTDRISIDELDTSNVELLGQLPSCDTYEHLKSCDILFVSSIDDPMTLTVLEALKLQKKVCFYKEIGWVTLLERFENVGVFTDYNVASALDELNKLNSVNNESEFFDISKCLDAYCDPLPYTARINMVLNYSGALNSNVNNNDFYEFRTTWTYKIGKLFTYLPGRFLTLLKKIRRKIINHFKK